MAKGFEPWYPSRESRKYLEEVLQVMAGNREEWPLTQRYWLYRLMALKGWSKFDEYKPSKHPAKKRHLCTPGKNLNLILDRGRRAGLVPWAAVVSKRGERVEPLNEHSPADLADYIEYHIERTQFDRQEGQPRQVVLWCETEGLVPLLTPVAEHYGAPLLAGRGFDTIGSKHDFACLVAKLGEALILHLGDLDKSGYTVKTSLNADLQAFIDSLGGRVTVQRIGLLEEHIEAYGLEFAATRSTRGLNAGNHGAGFDSRWECQLEAMNAADLRDLARAEFETALDMDRFRTRLEYEKEARREAIDILRERMGAC